MPRQLTAKQKAVLDFIIKYDREDRGWPTYEDFSQEFGYKSSNSITQNLKALVKKGHLIHADGGYQLKPNEPTVPAGIPVLGEISAGMLQEAVEANLGQITLETIFPNLDRIFAVRVRGESMVGAEIHDGDYVLLTDDDIPDGGIGAILYNGETSLKRVFMDHRGLRLEPANPEYNEISVSPDIFEEVKILGRYIGHVNKSGILKSPGMYQISTRSYSPFGQGTET
ncbi:MAG: repressor LexA [Bacteroidetes bacterium]|nr:repressor LexA [Bacteroidota bacterium]MCY4205053.1 repressor LexA [Bacteroidota bacterium]